MRLLILLLAGVGICWSPLVGVRVGEASRPGPADWSTSLDMEFDCFDYIEHDMEDGAEFGQYASGHHCGAAPPVEVENNRGRSGGGIPLCSSAPFIAANSFVGAREGYVYKRSWLGLGYYIDDHSDMFADDGAASRAWPDYIAHVAGMVPKHVPFCGGVQRFSWTISLCDMLFGTPSEAPVSRSRAPRKVKPKRKPRRRRAGTSLVEVPTFIAAGSSLHRDTQLWAIDTCNPNCSGGAQSYMDKSSADFCLFQEMKLVSEPSVSSAQRLAQRSGWGLSVAAAVVTDKGGVSAGVAVAARSYFGMTSPAVQDLCLSAKGRISVAHVGACCKGGLHLVSIYLWCNEGMSKRNLDVLQCVAKVLSSLHGPWILAADFNCTPEALLATGWLHLTRGCIIHADAPTCGKRCYDFFVVSQGLRGAVLGASVVDDAGFFPHSPSRLWLIGRPRSHRVRSLVAPRKWAANVPKGCANDPTATSQVIAACPDDIDSLAALAFQLADAELCAMHGLTGEDARKASGRDRGPKFVWKVAVGPPGSSQPRCSAVTSAWKTVSAWLKLLLIHWHSQFGASGCFRTLQNTKRKLVHTDWSFLGSGINATIFRTWYASLLPTMLGNNVGIMFLHKAVSSVAESAAKYDQNQSRASWLSWLENGPSRGLGKQHRMSRTALGWLPSKLGPVAIDFGDDAATPIDDVDGLDDRFLDSCEVFMQAPLDRQQTVDAEAGEWASIWNVGCKQYPIKWPECMGTAMPPLSVRVFRDACATFAELVGLGWDKMHPRALASCSDALIGLFIRVLIWAESKGEWFRAIGVVMIALIPKSDGGRRPIGLFPTLIRIWMRSRLDIAQAWESSHERPYFYAGPAKGADVAAWKQSLLAEKARSLRLPYASSLLDLIKCFDSVPFDWLVMQAEKYRYNLFLLRLSIASYLLARVLDVEGCCSGFVFPSRGLTAGSVLATIELRVLLIEFADASVASSLHSRITLYVDDATIETVATVKSVLREHLRALGSFIEGVHATRMSFSSTKNVCCASSRGLSRAIVRECKSISIQAVDDVISLGSGYAAGVRRRTGKSQKRLKAFVARRHRFKTLKRAKVNTARLLRTGGVSALTFGSGPLGVSNSMLLSQRRAVVASNCVLSCGADLDMSLVIADEFNGHSADPAFDAHCGVIVMWSLCVFEGWAPFSFLSNLVNSARRRLASAKSLWSRVFGPAAALVATMDRLGWSFTSPFVFSADDGAIIDLMVDSPAYVKGAVCDSVSRWRWRRVEAKLPALESGGRGLGAWDLPIRSALNMRNCESWGPEHKGAYKSVAAGRQWTQQRLFSAGLVESKLCQLCLHLPGGGHIGTALHRLTCPALHSFREQCMPKWIADHISECNGVFSSIDLCALTRGLVATPIVPPRDDVLYDTFHFQSIATEIPIGCRIFTDGSLLDRRFGKDCAAIGWAFVAIGPDGERIAAASGVPPRWIDSIQGAELWAVQMALTSIPLPSALYTDCQTVQQGLKRSRSWTHSSKRRFARVWSLVHANLDYGDRSNILVWMPAHLSAVRVGQATCSDGTAVSEEMWAANQLADLLAKDAASSVQIDDATRRMLRERFHRAKQLVVFVGQLTYAANHHIGPGGTIMRDSMGIDGRRRYKTEMRKPTVPAHRTPATASASSASLAANEAWMKDFVYPPSDGADARRGRVPSVAAKRVAKAKAAEVAAGARSENAFYTWWREERDARLALSTQRSNGPSGSARLEALRARVILRAGMQSASAQDDG